MLGLSQGDTEKHETAWIVLRNRSGEERDLFWTPAREAEAKRRRVEEELNDLPFTEWCERYGVPLAFVESPL